jgi:hypothetical protein
MIPARSALIPSTKNRTPKQAAEKLIALKGHDFSRATKSIESMRALAPEGCLPPVSPGIPSFPAASKARIAQASRWLGAAILILASASPALLTAQFQAPTPEELTMTADPKAPGASAVYLYYEEIADALQLTSSRFERIKVLTEKGKELATVSFPYELGVDKVVSIEGRTIHSDGTVIPLTEKSSDLTELKTKNYQLNSVVFTLPDVQIGSILEYRIKMRRDDGWTYVPSWQVQRKYFVRKAHYAYRPSGSQHLMCTSQVGPSAKVVKGKGDWITLDIDDVPPEPDDDWMPPINALRWRVEFFASWADSGDKFWINTRQNWADWIREFTNPTGPIKNAVAQIVARGDTDEQKAQKLYAAVQKLDNTDFSRTKTEAERKKEKLKEIEKADDVWKNQSGSANDIALLYASMARAAGLKVSPVFVVNRDRALFDQNYLSGSQFDNDVVIVSLGGKDVYLDPGQKMCPFGRLHWKHTLATGLRLTDKGAEIESTPALTYKDSAVVRVANLTIDETGNLTGTVRFVMNGPAALHWRQLGLENDEEEVKKQFNESVRAYLPEGVQADFDHFIGLQDSNTNLVATIKVSGTIGTVTGKRFFLPGFFLESRASHPFIAQDKRTIPVDVHYPMMEQDDVTYYLPPGFKVDSAPQDANSVWPDHAILKIHSSAIKDTITISRAFAHNFTILNPKEYPDLHDFYLKVAAADQQPLVLARIPATQGN